MCLYYKDIGEVFVFESRPYQIGIRIWKFIRIRKETFECWKKINLSHTFSANSRNQLSTVDHCQTL